MVAGLFLLPPQNATKMIEHIAFEILLSKVIQNPKSKIFYRADAVETENLQKVFCLFFKAGKIGQQTGAACQEIGFIAGGKTPDKTYRIWREHLAMVASTDALASQLLKKIKKKSKIFTESSHSHRTSGRFLDANFSKLSHNMGSEKKNFSR